MRVIHYFDYKSPYAYLAQEETAALDAIAGAELILRPYTLDIPDYLGRAEVDEAGRVLIDERSPHQWRRVRYAYLDCRREANRRGLTLRGPRRIFDSSVAHIGFLWATQQGDPRPYHNAVYERFWRRELDLGAISAVQDQLLRSGFDASGFENWVSGEGRVEHDRLRADSEERGVFGVPSYLVGDELFFGNERLCRVRERLEGTRPGK